MMNKHTLKIPIKKAESLAEFKRKNGQRKLGMVYYQLLPNGGWIVRTITHQTDPEFLKSLLEQERLFVAEEELVSEMS